MTSNKGYKFTVNSGWRLDKFLYKFVCLVFLKTSVSFKILDMSISSI